MLPETSLRCSIPGSYYHCSVEIILIIQGQSTGVTNCPTVPRTEGFLRGSTGGRTFSAKTGKQAKVGHLNSTQHRHILKKDRVARWLTTEKK